MLAYIAYMDPIDHSWDKSTAGEIENNLVGL